MDGETWMKERQDRAKADFARHEMKVIGPGHWQIRRPDSGQHWADIVVMANVGLAVWGDIEGCFFAYCSGAQKPEDVVAWMAGADVSYYGRQKANIGMTGSELVDEYVDEVALYDLERQLEREKEGYDDGWEDVAETYTEAFEDAARSIRNGEPIMRALDELCHDLINEDQCAYEWVYSIGRVTSCRVIYALAAVARLHELLQAES